MKTDRGLYRILPISRVGLMQITRQRMKPEIEIKTDETCPSCGGSGKIGSTLVLEDEIRKNLDYLLTHGHKNLTLMVHPMMASFLQKGFPSKRMQWSWKHRQWIRLQASANMHLIDFKFLDPDHEEIKL